MRRCRSRRAIRPWRKRSPRRTIPISAVVYYQRVYYGYPVTPEAAQSDAELKKLRDALGEKYPPAMPNAMLSRAVKLMEAKQYAKARTELESLVPQLGGAEKDLARVRIPVADYYAKETARAHAALASLEVSTPEADAERLHFLLLCAQRPASSMPLITSPPTGAAGYPPAARTTVTAAPGSPGQLARGGQVAGSCCGQQSRLAGFRAGPARPAPRGRRSGR